MKETKEEDQYKHCFRCGAIGLLPEMPWGWEDNKCPYCGEKSLLTLTEVLDLLNDAFVRKQIRLPTGAYRNEE